ncbi:MAG TPA: MraY family glycosyltransferase [Lentisphaeria bacterium]|nr:MraY family glycosyltransferase [Lentisphaeria bacterium]
MNGLLIDLLVWAVAMVLAWLCTWACRHLAPKLGCVDRPKHEAHKNHAAATPVLGGVGMAAAWLLTLVVGLVVFGVLGRSEGFPLAEYHAGLAAVLPRLAMIGGMATVLAVIGLVDDLRPMPAWLKFLLQAVVAGITAGLGLRISFLSAIPGANWLVTTLWIMTVINAINFFDNMDGLAGGTAVIAAFFLLFVAVLRGQYFVAVLAASVGCVASGFLVHNAPPARIFMGDSGSHFLGYCLAVLGILTTFYLPSESPTPAPLLIPVLALGVPLFDAVAVVVIRLRAGLPIYVGDNRHISHRFVRLGLTRPQAVLLVLLLCFMVGAAALTLLWLPPAGSLLVIAQIAAVLAAISMIQFYVQERKKP